MPAASLVAFPDAGRCPDLGISPGDSVVAVTVAGVADKSRRACPPAEARGLLPFRPHFMRSRDEFEWRTGELFDAMAAGTVTVSVSGRYALKEAAQAHRDLQERKTVGSVVLTP